MHESPGTRLPPADAPDPSATALTEWIMGDCLPGDTTLNRFFAPHVIALPTVLLLPHRAVRHRLRG